MTLRIAASRDADRAIVVRFVAAIQEHERTRVPELRPADEVAAAYADWLADTVRKRDGLLLLAWDDDQPVGLIAAWSASDDDMNLRPEHRSYVDVADLFVVDTHRRRGVARALLADVEATMRARGCTQIRLTSKASNVEALATYDATGFKPYEVILWKPLTPSG